MVVGEVLRIKSHKNLPQYTANEPDGWGDPSDAVTFAYDTVYETNRCHLVLLVLARTTVGQDPSRFADKLIEVCVHVLLVDLPDVRLVVIFHKLTRRPVVWDAESAPDYGDCWCDKLDRKFEVMSWRVDQLGDQLRALG